MLVAGLKRYAGYGLASFGLTGFFGGAGNSGSGQLDNSTNRQKWLREIVVDVEVVDVVTAWKIHVGIE